MAAKKKQSIAAWLRANPGATVGKALAFARRTGRSDATVYGQVKRLGLHVGEGRVLVAAKAKRKAKK